jgi:hypothetical protein
MKPEQWTLSGVFSGVGRIGGMATPIVQALILSTTTIMPNRKALNSQSFIYADDIAVINSGKFCRMQDLD